MGNSAKRGSLLGSTAMAATAIMMFQAAPAMADCPVPAGGACVWGGTGGAGSPAPSSGAPSNGNGHDGGPGDPGPSGGLTIDGRNWVAIAQLGFSPVQLFTIGGAGAQGSDATAGLDGKSGGSGGRGGDGGSLNITLGSGMSGSTSGPIAAISIFSGGGEGGAGASANLSTDDDQNGVGGIGGTGGTLTLDIDGTWPFNTNDATTGRSLATASTGGAGGYGRDWKAGLNEDGIDGGAGGLGGTMDVILRGTFNNAMGAAIFSGGGTGGAGGQSEQWPGSIGGAGGAGGQGGTVNVTTTSTSYFGTTTGYDAALGFSSQGGTGGVGGSGPSGGNAGAGGAGGDITLTLQGGQFVATGSTASVGILAQSLGGNGGDGGSGGHVIGPNGGAGSAGGTPGTVTINGGGLATITTGQNMGPDGDPTVFGYSPGILAQAIGGGGGSGGDANGWLAVGGDGGAGVNGNAVSVEVQANITTWGTNSDGIAVQSIGGGGGKGGDAKGSGVEVNMIIGGTGGGGGDGAGAAAHLESSSAITTYGTHSSAIVIQSVGGGGGAGGAAYSKSTNLFYGASISLGGSGGNGGNGSTVGFVTGASSTNEGRIITSGADSHGILGQSIGGGGGIGGASTAISKTYSDDDYPSMSLTLAMGGSGGNGGVGGTVRLDNSGLILSTGGGSIGVIAQSIGGGGGTGGDASSASTATGGAVNISSSFTFGGKAGSGSHGGIASISNNGIIITTGESADAMLVQSIGGGGGNGGGGDGKSSTSGGDNSTSISATITMGGTAGGGGDGQSVTATNLGSIITLGDSAFGVAAQSIGGGGGRGGGAAGSASGDFTGTATVGGSGGNGGNANGADAVNAESTVTVNNKAGATIVTFGGDANGIIAQSIGGGGGAAGKAGSNISTKKSTNDGGNGDAAGKQNTISGMTQAFDANGMAGLQQYAGLNGAINTVNSLLGNSNSVSLLGDEDPDSALDDASQSKGETDDDNDSSSINISVAVGGTGGSGGDGGAVVVQNDGEVATLGHHADAIVAMSIGGGGGKGGAATTAASDDNKNGNVSVGGSGGSGGSGSTTSITNTGAIFTKGALSAGIVGQSIAGGGGIGGASASSVSASSKNNGDDDANDGAFKSLQVSVGGKGGTSAESGQVTISNSGAISTAAHDSIGIIAQSITGGGGIVKTLAVDLEGAGGSASATGTKYDINFQFGGSNGSTSQGSGRVEVTTTAGGTITTKGDNAYGILAQSIAGGGGVALGGTAKGSSVADFFGSGTTSGSVIDDGKNDPTDPNGNSGLFVTVGADISTGFKQKDGTVTGKGASAVIAQSIGGGGGLAGDTGWTQQHFGFGGGGTNRTGNGGVVDVTIDAGVNITAIGDNTTAIIAQSIGGGGGYIANSNGLFTGTAGGHGYGNNVTVTNSGTITVTGAYAMGIFAQSDGDGSQHGRIAIDNHGTINGSASNWAVYFDHGGTQAENNNVLNNWGTINSGSASGYAVYGNAGFVYITNSGNIWGQIDLTSNGGNGYLDIIASGTVHSTSINVGNNCTATNCSVSNAGTLDMRSADGAARITGHYIGKAGSRLVLAADFAGGKGTQLVIDGNAAIDGTVDVRASSMRNKPLTLINATGQLTLGQSLQSSGTHLFDYALTTDGKLLTVTPRAHFTEKATQLGHNSQAVANGLQSLFDSGASADVAFGRLMSVADDAGYASALDSLAGGGLGAFGAFRFNSSRSFAANLYGGCNDLQFASRSADRCGWARVLVNNSTQDSSADRLGYKADSWAMQKGLQLPLSDTLALTLSSAYENTKFRDGDARIKGGSIVAGIGLFYGAERLELSGAIDAAYGWYKSSRSIALGGISEQASAKPEQSQIGGHVRASYSLSAGSNGFVRPFVEGHAIRVSNKAFTETGPSPFRLAVEGQADTALIGVAGLEVGTKLPLSAKVMLRPFASAALEYGSPRSWTTTARFAEQPQGDSFDLTTAGPETLGRFAIGADLLGSKNVAFSVQYAPELGKGFTSHSGTARLTIAF
ncbi:autotransporter outer membrane beta-barrel domain-containing protein [Sandaracinobacter neustonicus]|uniref:Autotransporter outer membrane beta-barrel domain-containing protein n=1 Tax=Sandaracinobacter neustonicus TaxID=1715348 RepID=A0A501XQV7_9SPHN|nr:autotransporter outer membrane beta-barrel domain-containing protein [Sandaracinobacter neustonicus]TPE63088.1 autotransporter outer membrane beta-barrel domain-containing protein [Sandaracinobacter neustonicus]